MFVVSLFLLPTATREEIRVFWSHWGKIIAKLTGQPTKPECMCVDKALILHVLLRRMTGKAVKNGQDS